MKEKIAISIRKDLVKALDEKIDGSLIRNRSQAIEFFLDKGLSDEAVDTAVILLSKDHQKYALKKIENTILIKKQIDLFKDNNIKNVFIITQHSSLVNEIADKTSETELNVRIFEKDVKGNAQALFSIKDKLPENFIAISGDIYNEFDLKKMVDKHMDSNQVATIGLMSRQKPSEYGAVILDGDIIIDFKEKSKDASSYVVNAGIYIFSIKIFNFINKNSLSLERDIFPSLSKISQVSGFFTHGKYIHAPEVK